MTLMPSPSPSFDNNLAYWLALWRIPDIGPKRFLQLLKLFPDLKDLFALPASELPSLNLPPSIFSGLKQPDWKAVEKDLRWSENEQCHIITCTDPIYPPQLNAIASAPPLLFVHGNVQSLSSDQIAIVGSRNPSLAGKEIATQFATLLSQEQLTITSGLALGIDSIAHQSTLKANGKTVAVLGSGINVIYPKRNQALAEKIIETKGALVSEFPTNVPPVSQNFPRRNRIVSGLSLGVLVIEATINSGSLITAQLAAEQGREVFAIPGSIRNPLTRGCHSLIKQGAKLTETVTDILQELSLSDHLRKSIPQSLAKAVEVSENTPSMQKLLAEDYKQLLQCIDFEATSLDKIAERSGLITSVVASMTAILELKGYVVTTVEGIYQRIW